MPFDLYSSRQLYAIMYDDRLEAAPNFFLDTFFPGAGYFSDTEEIVFSKIPSQRKLAPFVLPTMQGKPIYNRLGETIQAFKPAYIKPKDAVRPSEMLRRQPGEILTAGFTGGGMSPQARYNAEVVRIAQYHRNSIQRTWEWMAAQVILNAAITINYMGDDGNSTNSVAIGFGRDAGHTVVKGSGARWGDSGINPVRDIETWSNTMAAAAFGGMPNRLILGTSAFAAFRASADVKDLLDTNFRGSENFQFNRGIVRQGDPAQPAVYVGNLDGNLEVWVYQGTFQANDGSLVNVMDPRDILLASPGIDGIKAFGAILDADAELLPVDIFPKMWRHQDPSATYIMSQSAPLMIPVNPNRTFRARVVA